MIVLGVVLLVLGIDLLAFIESRSEFPRILMGFVFAVLGILCIIFGVF